MLAPFQQLAGDDRAAPKRSQSPPKRVRFADQPSFHRAAPHCVFSRPLTASAFPSAVKDPPALCATAWRPPAPRLARLPSALLAVALALAAALAYSWWAGAGVVPAELLACLGVDPPDSPGEVRLAVSLVFAAGAFMVLIYPLGAGGTRQAVMVPFE
jgi:hypothetical protein